MRIEIGPRLALTLLACVTIYCADVWLYAWQESGPAPISYTRSIRI